MLWVRVLTGFSLGALLMRNYWFTLLKALGISTDIYDKHEEEQQIVKTTTIDRKTGKTHTTTTMRKGNERLVFKD